MKTCFSVVMMIVILTASAWGQEARQPPAGVNFVTNPVPPTAGEKEMDILSGIIHSELASHMDDRLTQLPSNPIGNMSYFRIGSSSSSSSDSSPTITVMSTSIPVPRYSLGDTVRFYLHGQGAVFMITVYGIRNSPLTSVALANNDLFNFDADDALERIRMLEARMQDPDARHEDLVAARQRINTLQRNLERIQSLNSFADSVDETIFRRFFDSLREPLVDILATYGDSLSVVKPDEYINLILHTPSLLNVAGRLQRVETISARKSWITDYKAGRITLDEFRKTVLEHSSK